MGKVMTFLGKRGPLVGVLFVATVKLLEVFGYTEAARGLATIGGVFGLGSDLPADLVVGIAAGAAGLGAAYKSFLVSRAWLKAPTLKVLFAVFSLPLLVGASCNPGDIPIPIPTPAPVACYDCASAASAAGLVRAKNAVPGAYIVVTKAAPARTAMESAVRRQEVRDLATRHGIEGATFFRSINAFAARFDTRKAQELAGNAAVAFVQEDGRKFATALSWGLDRVDQRDLPLDKKYEPGASGQEVHVFVVDTGCPAGSNLQSCRQDHPDFGSRLVAECFSAITFGGCMDQHGHGTHVAGTAAGSVWGVAKGVWLHGVRVLDQQGSGTDSQVIAGIDYVTQWKLDHPSMGVVLNMSLGGGPAPALDAAVCRANAAGVVVVVAGGNDSGADVCSASPARVLQAVTVAASDSDDAPAFFSNVGATVDVWAPGVDIESDTSQGGTATFSGTSMASPHVAGAAALYLFRHPGSSPAEVEAGLKGNASAGKIGGAPTGTTQALLYVKE